MSGRTVIDFYELLGVSRDADQEEIKRAYRRGAREHHPDANPDDPDAEERFKEFQVAYEVLSDPEKRRRYDMYGADHRGQPGGPGFSGFSINDLFDSIFGGDPFGGGGPFGGGPFGGRTGPRAAEPGADLGVDCELSFTEAVFGTEREIGVRVRVACTSCEATGAAPGTEPVTCRTCGGVGEVQQVRRTMLGQIVTAGPCHDCDGTGRQISDPCRDCRGEGRIAQVVNLPIRVPAGIDDGARLRVSGRGDVGRRGGAAGDLYVRFHVGAPPPGWSRDDADLHYRLAVPMTTAALGGKLSFSTLDGATCDVEVMPATSTGERVRFRGQGVPRLRGGGRGDIIATLVVETPSGLDAEQESLLRRLADLRGENTETPGMMSRIRNAFR